LWGGPPARPVCPIDLRARPVRVKRALTGGHGKSNLPCPRWLPPGPPRGCGSGRVRDVGRGPCGQQREGGRGREGRTGVDADGANGSVGTDGSGRYGYVGTVAMAGIVKRVRT
jgi:hypothetical protein